MQPFALGEAVDERADLYSLGALLHQMLTGRPPHVGRSTVATLLSRLRDPAPDVRDVRPEVPGDLAATVSRLLAQDPDARPLSAAEVLADLEPYRRPRLHRAALSLASRGGRRRFRLAAAVVVLFLAASAFALHELRPETRFREVIHGPEGFSGIGPDGEILWQLPGRVGALTLARLRPGERPLLVGVVHPPGGFEPEHTRRLSILDPESGLTIRELELVSGQSHFSGFSGINNRFGYTRAVAAVRPAPVVNRTGPAVPASSPDGTPFMSDHALVWYTLLPPGSSGDLHWLTSTDPRDRVLRLSGPSGGSMRLSYDEHAIYRAYLCWRDGHLPTRRFRIEGLSQTDVTRYLILELRRARGESAPELLLAVDEEIRHSSDTLPMLLSLRAELLAERGRSGEASVSVREALDGIERPIDDEIYGRAFRWLVEERAERLGVTTEKEG